MERIEEIRERLNKATPGPWEYRNTADYAEIYKSPIKAASIPSALVSNEDNADLIAHAPDDIKYLLEQITALQDENERLKEADALSNKLINQQFDLIQEIEKESGSK